jgi:hypothetical protein
VASAPSNASPLHELITEDRSLLLEDRSLLEDLPIFELAIQPAPDPNQSIVSLTWPIAARA